MSWEGKATEGDNVSWEGGAHVSREGRLCKSRENQNRRMIFRNMCTVCVPYNTVHLVCSVYIWVCSCLCMYMCTVHVLCMWCVYLCVLYVCVNHCSVCVLLICNTIATQAITMVCVGYN